MDYKTLFKEQSLHNNSCGVIFSNTFSTFYPVSGCYEYNGQFIVYSIDESDHIFNVKRYHNPIEAYSDLANRLGFEFNISEPNTPNSYWKKLLQEIENEHESALRAPINFEGKCELDCKELFRKQLLQHKEARDNCIIDSNTFSKIAPVDGCFEYGNQFIVYSIDERNHIYDIMRFTNSFRAYYELAKRLGFELKEPQIDPQKDFLKEKFKKKLAEYEETIGISINCDIDTPNFSDKFPVHGCFYDANAWYVYSIDEDNNIFNVEKHSNCFDTYSDLAKRIGFVFEVE